MPQTRKKPVPSQGTPPLTIDGTTEVLNLAETAAYLRLAEADVVRLVQEQGLPGRQIGAEWRFLKSAIQDWLRTGPTAAVAGQDFWEACAGAFRDDPHLAEIVQEAYRRRGRPITEDE